MAEKPAVNLETAAGQPTHFREISEDIEKISELPQKSAKRSIKSAVPHK